MRATTAKMHAEGKFPKKFTKPHIMLIDAMKKNSIYDGFESEVLVGFHSIDIANIKRKIAIQVDGDYYHVNPEWMKKRNRKKIDAIQKRNIGQDKSCNTYLKNKKWIILRFWASDIENNIDVVIKKIKEVL